MDTGQYENVDCLQWLIKNSIYIQMAIMYTWKLRFKNDWKISNVCKRCC